MALMGCNFAIKDYEFCKNKQKEGVVYEYIKSFIVAQTDFRHNQNGLNQPLFQRLNNSNLGVTCTVKQCNYHDYEISTMNNIKSENSRLSRTGRTDYYISFNPNQFEQSYQAWKEHSDDDKEVPFKRTLLRNK